MKGQTPLFSHDNDNWGTPDKIFTPLDKEFEFECDLAATEENSKCKLFFDQEVNALNCDWTKFRADWLNPPFSQNEAFTKKAKEEAMRGATVVCILAIRSDTPWFQRYVLGYDTEGNYVGGAHEIRYIPGRVQFIKTAPKPMTRYDYEEKRKKYQYSAPFPCVIAIFRPGNPEYLLTASFINPQRKRQVINNVR